MRTKSERTLLIEALGKATLSTFKTTEEAELARKLRSVLLNNNKSSSPKTDGK